MFLYVAVHEIDSFCTIVSEQYHVHYPWRKFGECKMIHIKGKWDYLLFKSKHLNVSVEYSFNIVYNIYLYV